MEDKIKEWLTKNGYPLEMEVARALVKNELGVVQSEYFEDPETGKFRETDIIAYEESRGENCRVISALTIECKSGKNKPWILFSNDEQYPSSLSVSRRASSDAGLSILRVLANRPNIQTLLPFALPKRTSYGVTVGLRDGNKDITYATLNSVGKAAIGIVKRLSQVEGQTLIPIAFPIIIIEAPLYQSYLDAEGELILEPADMGVLVWKNPLVARHSLIHIFRKERFIAELPSYRDHLLEFCAYAAQEYDRSPRESG